MENEQAKPFVSDERDYSYAPTSTAVMRRLKDLEIRTPALGKRNQIAESSGHETLEDAYEARGIEWPADMLTEADFYEKVLPILLQELDPEDVEEGSVDFAAAREAYHTFIGAGVGRLMGQMSG